MQTAQLAVVPTASIPIHDPAIHTGPRGLRVNAIGSMRVSQGRLTIRALGGPKAGNNQALGLFGFLFDRGRQGVDKDDAIEMIWPDVPIEMADTAFHRTILGLRGTLRGGGFDDAIQLVNGRYALASGLVSWSDTWEVEWLVDRSAASRSARQQVESLEACRQLNAADYMDDCPFFGSSAFAEPRRRMLREVRHAVLLELAALYDASGHRALAAIRRSEARDVAVDDMERYVAAPAL
jgi:two-component SAPR family response regulator